MPSRGERDVFERAVNPQTGLSALQGFIGQSRNQAARSRGFTLIEIIGVLAVISILVAVIVPSVIRRVDRAAWTRETADLTAIADSYTQYILRSQIVPGTNAWASAVANQMSLPVSAITTNSRRYARAFLVDPAFQIGTNVAGQSYTQTTKGAAKPIGARVMIVSSLGRALPVSTSIPNSTEFNAIWNTAEGAKPSTATWTSWAGSGEDLRIKKLNLEPLFYQLILVDHRRDTNRATPYYSIDSTNGVAIQVDASTGLKMLNAQYLDGTVVGMYGVYNSSTNLQSRHLLKRNISFVFEADWQREIQGDEQSYSSSGADFYNHALTFFSKPNSPWASQEHGASQFGVMISMYTFMFDYTYWANECPHFNYHGNNASSVPEYVLLHNQGQNGGNVDGFSTALITAH